jgi:ABC-type branched-subunit amino acid transport system substrate-binding protein
MADVQNNGSRKIIIHEKNIIADFFDLKTKIAGDILQKFVNYQVQLAIIGDFSKFTSKSLKDFIYESNKQGRIFFVNSLEDAEESLVKFN